MRQTMLLMEKSIFILVTAVLVGLCHCFIVSKCNPAATTTSANLQFGKSSSSASASSVVSEVDSLADEAASSSMMDFNDSDIFDFNVSDVSMDDMQRINFARRWEHLRERKKQQRLFIIQNRIKDLLGFPRKPNVTSSHISNTERQRMAHLFEILQTQRQPSEPDDISAERVQSFYPSCAYPRNTDRELWEDPQYFHMYYDISMPHLVQSTSLSVSSAKLRLFKLSSMDSECEILSDDSPETTEHGDRLRISIFQYVRPLKRNRKLKKKKLVDSRMVSADYAGWLDFDVGSSIRDWLENSSKNLGLEVVLEDALANNQNPSHYIHNMNCSNANDPPFPRFMEEHPQLGENESALFENETYPTLDLRTVEVMEADIVAAKNDVNRRRKRNVHDSNCDGWNFSSASCCAVDLDISFEELGFDGIVAPKGFRTKVCVGLCGAANDEPNNALDDKVMTCEPSETEGLVVLHYNDEEKLVIRTITDVIVKSCGCSLA